MQKNEINADVANELAAEGLVLDGVLEEFTQHNGRIYPDVEVEPLVIPKNSFRPAVKQQRDIETYRKNRSRKNKAARKSRKINRKNK